MAEDFVSGALAGQEYAQRAQLFPLQKQEEQTKVSADKLALQQQQRMMQLSQNMDPHADPLTQLSTLASGLVQGGQPEQGAALLDKVSAIQDRKAQAADRRATLMKENAQWVEDHIDQVHDQGSWQDLLMQFHAERGEASIYAQQPYSPQIVERIKGSVEHVKQQAEIEATKARVEQERAAAKLEPIHQQLEEAQVREAKVRTTNLEKTGAMLDAGKANQGVVGMVLAGMPLATAVPGWGASATTQRAQARDAAIAALKTDNPDMTDIEAGLELARRQIGYQAGKSSVTQLTTMLGATRQASGQLNYNVDQATKEMKKLGSSNLSPLINAIARGEERWTGDPAYSGLYLYMYGAATESARLMSGGQASRAQLHQGAADEAKKWANANQTTPAAWAEVASAMKAEGEYRIKTFTDAIEQQEPSATTKPKTNGGPTLIYDPKTGTFK